MGLSFSSVFLNPSSKHSHITTSHCLRTCAHHLRPRRLPTDHLLLCGIRGWGGPIPHCRDCWVSEKLRVQEERWKKQVKYSCFFSSTCSLHIVVKDAGIHLGEAGWEEKETTILVWVRTKRTTQFSNLSHSTSYRRLRTNAAVKWQFSPQCK